MIVLKVTEKEIKRKKSTNTTEGSTPVKILSALSNLAFYKEKFRFAFNGLFLINCNIYFVLMKY